MMDTGTTELLNSATLTQSLPPQPSPPGNQRGSTGATPTGVDAHNVLMSCGEYFVRAFSKDPKGLALSLHGVGFISDDTLDKTNSLNEISRDKARRLYTEVLGKVKCFPHRYAELVSILEQNRTLYGDLFMDLFIDQTYRELESKQHFDEAMKAGYVTVQIKNVLLFGMAGAGKTSVQNLIFGLPPPEVRSSTPVADAPKRVIRNVSRVKVQAGEGSWKPVTSEELEEMVIDSIRSFADELKEVPKDLGTKLKPSSETNVSGKTDGEGVETSSTSGNTAVANDRLSSSFSDEKQRFTNMIEEIVDAFVKPFPWGAAIGQLFKKVWVYFTDSGGQPHFHNLLPLFIQGISAALFVLRLCEGLDEHPMVEYYKDGELASKSYPAALTTLDNFKYLVQSLYSRSEDGKLGLVCIGTHLDKVSECSETLEQKNEKLLQLLPQDLLRENVHFYDLGKELIFPVDAKNIVPDREDMARKLCEAIENCPPHEIDVPFWWYTFEIILHKLSGKLDRRVLSREECLEVAHRLNFHVDALTAALDFFHKHHIFHYYPQILPNVVFCDTQVLLDKVTELVEHASFLRDSSSPVSLPGNWLDFKDRGIITLEFIKEFKKHYVADLFGPPELIKIFKDLLILTPLSGSLHGEVNLSSDKVEYFMPSLLDMLPQSDLEGHRVCSSEAAPLLFQYRNGWPRCGVFCCLQVYLIQHCNWELCLDQIKPMQNIVQLQPPDSPCIVILVDLFSRIELYVDSHDPDCQSEYPSFREQLLDGIKASCKALRYSQDPPELAFICPCEQPQVEVTSQASSMPDPSAVSGGQEHHVALINKKYMKLKCTKTENRRKLFPLEMKHKVWLPEPCLSSSLLHESEKQSEDASCVPQSSSSFTVHTSPPGPQSSSYRPVTTTNNAPAVVDRLLEENPRLRSDNDYLSGYKDGTDGRTGDGQSSQTGVQATGVSDISVKSASLYWGLNNFSNDYNGNGVLIAVLDTGVNPEHFALKRKVKCGRNFVGPDPTAYHDTDGLCHGTGVAGVAVGKHLIPQQLPQTFSGVSNKIPVGVAPGASLVVCRVAEGKDGFSPFCVAKALEWILDHNAVVMDMYSRPEKEEDHHAKNCSLDHELREENRIRIVSMSFKLTDDNQDIGNLIERLKLDQGVVCVAGVGNDGNNKEPGWPARYSSCLTVGSVNIDGEISSFSTRHRCVDVFTLGEDVLVPVNTTPPASGAGGSSGASNSSVTKAVDKKFGIVSGTSFATPAVAGLIAILLQCAKDCSKETLRDITNLVTLKYLFEKYLTVPLQTPKGEPLLQPGKIQGFFNNDVKDLDNVVKNLRHVD